MAKGFTEPRSKFNGFTGGVMVRSEMEGWLLARRAPLTDFSRFAEKLKSSTIGITRL